MENRHKRYNVVEVTGAQELQELLSSVKERYGRHAYVHSVMVAVPGNEEYEPGYTVIVELLPGT